MQSLTEELGTTLTRLNDLTERALRLLADLREQAVVPPVEKNDHAALEELVEVMGALEPARDLARTYLLGLPARVDRMLEAFVVGDESAGARLAGELDVASSLVGAEALRRCCRDVVTQRRVDPAVLRAAATATEQWLKDWLAAT